MADSQEQSARGNNIPRLKVINRSDRGATINCVAWLPDDRIVTGSDDKTVRIWNSTNGTQEGTSMVHQSPVMGIVTTKDGGIISFTSQSNHPIVWKVETQELVNGPWSKEDYHGPIRAIALSRNEEPLAAFHEDRIVFWDMVGTMRVRSYIDLKSIGYSSNPGFRVRGCFSPDGKRLAYSFMSDLIGKGMTVELDVESGETILGPPGPEMKGIGICAVAWLLDGARLLCGCTDGEIRCLNSRTGDTIGEPWRSNEAREPVHSLSLSPDGKWLASVSLSSYDSRGTIRLWNVESSNLAGEPLQHGIHVQQIAFSQSGEFIACVGHVGSISVWRVPWWDNDHQKSLDPLLDLSAVVSSDGPSNVPRETDLAFLDVSQAGPHRPLPPHGRSRVNPSDDTPRMQSSARSWRWWKKLPRLVFDRLNTIYMGLGPPRVYVASRDDIHSSPQLPAQHTDDTAIAESPSGETSDESTTDSTPDDLEVGGIGCCGLLPRRRTRAIPEQPAVSVVPSAPTSRPLDSSIPPCTSSAPTQDIFELPAVIRWP